MLQGMVAAGLKDEGEVEDHRVIIREKGKDGRLVNGE
jgi:hypothetical protein